MEKNKYEEIFVCPKCMSTNWQTPQISPGRIPIEGMMGGAPAYKKCMECGYVGDFVVARKGELSKKDLEILKDFRK